MRHVVTQQLILRIQESLNANKNAKSKSNVKLIKKREQAQTIKSTTKRIIKTINN